MTLLNEEGFTTLSLEDYYEATQGRRELPDRTALVTFDDGFADNYLEAWPIARRIGVNLNLFICTALVSGNTPQAFQNYSVVDQHSREEFPRHWQPLTCNQLREMATAGVGIGFHSHNHLNLGTLTSAEITLDTSTGVTIFQQCLQRAPQFFAFPYGHFGSYSQEAVEVLSDNGFEMFFSTELGRTQLGNADQVISRIVIHPEDNINSFRRKLFGGYDWVGRVRRRVYAIRSSFRKPPNRLSRA